jgi:eukaryotic-like serine/threonine-protein kinase
VSEAAVTRADGEPLIIGRYALFDALASGGMATVHLGRLLGPVGFGRTVAIKRLHSHFTADQDFVTMFMDEAHIVARIRHPNVVPMVDVIESSKGLFLVMEYVHGESLSRLLRTCRVASQPIPVKLLNTIMHGVLLGLHAAHETKGSDGELLNVVHRDVSPQNVIVGSDGVARVLDFGVAKAAGRAQVTREGQIKGKLTYMAPEQIRGKADRRADVFAASVVLWEALAGRRFHEGAKDVEVVTRVVKGEFDPPSKYRPDLSAEMDAITMRGLEIDPDKRYQTAREMALDLERKVGLVSPSEVGEWVERLATDVLLTRANMVSAMEQVSGSLVAAESRPPRSMAFQNGATEPNAAYSSAPRPGFPIDHNTPPNGMPPYLMALHDPISDMQATPPGTELPIVEERRDLAPVIAILTFCGALLIAGIVLGALSFVAGKRSPDRSTRPPASSSLPPSRATAPATPTAKPSSSATATPTSRTHPTTPKSSSSPGARSAADAPEGAPTNAASTATAVRPPVVPTAAPAPTPKKAECDPPYVVDEAGHRKYKRECMGTD